jgi:chromosome partitioning protein
MIVAVINQKGGVGKTTLAVHLACYFKDQGKRVAFVDADAQESGKRWLNRIDPTLPVLTPRNGQEVHETVVAADSKYDVVVCDGPPRLNDVTRVLMYIADRVLMPVCPSTVDLEATLQAKDEIDRVNQARTSDGLSAARVWLVVNRYRASTELSRTVVAVAGSLGISLARQTIGLRDIYAKAAARNTVVTRLIKDKTAKQAAEELTSLFNEVIEDESSIQAQAA